METKNFIVEVIEGGEDTRTFIVRELGAPNQPAQVRFVASNADELAQFFGSSELFK